MRLLQMLITISLRAVVAVVAQSTLDEARVAPANGVGIRVCSNSLDIFNAVLDSSVQIILIPNDISLCSVEWSSSAAPVTLGRNLTVLGVYEDADIWPVFDMCYVTAKVLPAPGVAFNMSRLVIMNWRRSPHFQVPGLDLIALRNTSSASDSASSRSISTSDLLPRLVVGWDAILIHRTCLPIWIYLGSVTSLVRPLSIPAGSQSATQLPDSPDCRNNTLAPAALRCWPGVGVFSDLGFNAMTLDQFGNTVYAGYAVWLYQVQIKCATVMSDTCIQTYGAVGCFYTMFPRVAFPGGLPALPGGDDPAAASSDRWGSQSAGPGAADSNAPDTQQQSSRSEAGEEPRGPLLGPLLGGIFGGVALLVALSALAVLVWRRRRRERIPAIYASGGGSSSNVLNCTTSALATSEVFFTAAGLDPSAKDDNGTARCGQEPAVQSSSTDPRVTLTSTSTFGLNAAPTSSGGGEGAAADSVSALPACSQEVSEASAAAAAATARVGADSVAVAMEAQTAAAAARHPVVHSVGGGCGGSPATATAAATAGPQRQASEGGVTVAWVTAPSAPSSELGADRADPGVSRRGGADTTTTLAAPVSTVGELWPGAGPGVMVRPPQAVGAGASGHPQRSGVVGCLPPQPQPPPAPPLLRCLEPEVALTPVTCVTPLRPGVQLEGARMEAQVKLLPMVLGKGSFGRVVEGVYGGERVAVKLLNKGLITGLPPLASPSPPAAIDAAGRGGAACATGCEAVGGGDAVTPGAGNDRLPVGAPGGGGGVNPAGQPLRQAQSQRLDSEAQGLEGLAQEVEVLARCQHPNIVRLLAACLEPPRVCLVMELMDTSLDRLVHGVHRRCLSLGSVLHIGIQVARALAYLHPTILHRDLKPANVLISQPNSETPLAKLADFGLSRLLQTVLVTQNPEVGTGPYIAPEAFDVTNTTITDRADIYGLGVILWEMLTGKRPWFGQTTVQIAFAVTVNEERLPLHDLSVDRCPPKLKALISACWDSDPARRPAAAEVVKSLLLVQAQLAALRDSGSAGVGGGGAAVAGAGDVGATSAANAYAANARPAAPATASDAASVAAAT